MSNFGCQLKPPQITIKTNITAEPVGNAIAAQIVSIIDIEKIIECDDTFIFLQDKLPLSTLIYIRPNSENQES